MIIAMIHLRALPGTAAYQNNASAIIDTALEEASIYQAAGIDALMIENMHDTPYLNGRVGPEITAMMAVIAARIKQVCSIPLGIQVLAGANKEALAIAKAADLDFVRVEGFVFSHVADEGMIHASAGELLRYRKQIDAEKVKIYTDIKKKHSAHAITADVDLLETAKAAAFFRSDGVIITGTSTGKKVDLEELKMLHGQLDIPIIIGSGITLDNVEDYLPYCDHLIVGSWFKEGGHWANKLSAERVKVFMEKVK